MEPQERKGLLGDALPDLKTMKLSDDALTGSFFLPWRQAMAQLAAHHEP
jgi:hypothetical protein